MKTPLTKEQIQSLILNAYGFMSRGNDLYFCQEDYVQDETFELVNIDGGSIEFNYNNAFICNGSVTFEDTILGEAITFTVLVVPTEGSGLMPQLLAQD